MGRVDRAERLLPWSIAFALGTFYAVYHALQERLITHDATLWISYGVQLFRGGLERFAFNGGAPPFSPLIWTPGYPFLVGLCGLVVGNPVTAAFTVSTLGIIGLSLVMYRYAETVFGVRSAVFTMLLTALYPLLTDYAVTTSIRPVALFWLFLGLHLTRRIAWKGGAVQAVVAGAVLGCAVLTRFEFAVYGVTAIVFVALRTVRKQVQLRKLVLFVAAMALVYAVYAVPLYRVTGYRVLSPYISRIVQKMPLPYKPRFNRENYRKANVGMWNVLYNHNTASRLNLLNQNRVTADPDEFKGRYDDVRPPVRPVWMNYADLVTGLLPELLLKLLPLVLMGTYFAVRDKRTAELSLSVSFVMVTLVLFPVLGGAGGVRYYSQVLPPLFLVSGYGISRVLDVLGKRVSLRPAVIAAAVILGVFLAVWNLRGLQRKLPEGDRMWLDAAAYLKEHGKPDDTVFARKRFAAFYAGLRSELLPDEQDLDDVYAYAAYIGADFLVLDRAVTCVAMPQYLPLMESDPPAALELLAEFNPGSVYACRIFRFTHLEDPAE